MKVYVLFESWVEEIDYEYGENIVGIYSTIEKAEEAKLQAEKEQKNEKANKKPWDEDCDNSSYYIEEYNVL